MKFRIIDEEDKGSTIEHFFTKKWIEEFQRKEADEQKRKEKFKGPRTVTVGYCLLILMAMAPFVGMAMSALLLAVYVKWAETMKALVNQL